MVAVRSCETRRVKMGGTIRTTRCTRCNREINGDRPRVCLACMTDHEKLTADYGPGYARTLGER